MDYTLEDTLNEIEPVGRVKMFTGKYKVYETMSDFNKQIKETDVYTREQIIEFAKVAITLASEIISEELDNESWETEGHGLVCSADPERVIKELFGDI